MNILNPFSVASRQRCKLTRKYMDVYHLTLLRFIYESLSGQSKSSLTEKYIFSWIIFFRLFPSHQLLKYFHLAHPPFPTEWARY